MEEKTNQKNLELNTNCNSFSNILSMQLNNFTNEYAVKYPVCPFSNNCEDCPYDLKYQNISLLNQKQKKALLDFYNEFHITPQNAILQESEDEQKLKLLFEVLDKNRTLFHREEERIIYTEELRRLQYKTQVMINSASDDQRTRLLHSLEVQKISRKIAIALKSNYELAETIAIAHDIGHAPFGHAGEYAIRNYLEKQLVGSFSHALQSVKVIDFICSHRALKPMGLKGLGVSDFVLEGVLKHDSDSFSDNISSAAFRLQYECPRLYKPVGISDEYYVDNEIYIGSIESQIVCWADKIAYMSHDWEEFVAVDLLEVMLSRINIMVIQLDDFIQESLGEKYSYLSDIEREMLKKVNIVFQELKDIFYSNIYSSDYDDNSDPFVIKLQELINVLENIIVLQKQHCSSFVFFSHEQYKLMRSFFKVAWAWIYITKVKPKKVGGKMDIIFVIYKYLSETTSHRTVPALIKALIDSCSAKLMLTDTAMHNRNALTKNCNNTWQQAKKNINCSDGIFTAQNKKQAKRVLKNSFAVCFNEKYSEAVDCIGSFIYDEYIGSTRIQFMTQKADIIVNKLLDFYYNNPQMLPLKQRKRIEFETSLSRIRNRTTELLKQYYIDRIAEAIHEDKSIENNHHNFEKIHKLIYIKVKNLTGIEFKTFSAENYEKMESAICELIDSNIQFATDAIRLRVIADYISGMTDRMAEKKYNEICSSSTQWSKAYTERGTFNV